MSQFNFKVQRFRPGHPLYSDAVMTGNDPATGKPRTFQATFGQMVDQNGKFIVYDLERRDTLIAEGTFEYTLAYSPNNKMIVILLLNVPNRKMIEFHIANTPIQLEGCTAPGSTINKYVPSVVGSTIAFDTVMSLVIGKPFKCRDLNGNLIPENQELLKPFIGKVLGAFTYESLQNQAA